MRLSQVVGGVLLVFSAGAYSQETLSMNGELAKGPYLSVAYIQADYDYDDSLSVSGNTYKLSYSDKSSGLKFGGGYRINPNVAVELDYNHIGTISDTLKVSGVSTGIKSDIDIKYALRGGLMVNTPLIKNRISAFGKLGYGSVKEEAKTTVGSRSFSTSDTGRGVVWGAGMLVRLTDQVAARIEYDNWDQIFKDADVNTVSAGLQFQF